MDTAIAVIIIVVAAAYLLRRWLRPSSSAGSGCPGCSGRNVCSPTECGCKQSENPDCRP